MVLVGAVAVATGRAVLGGLLVLWGLLVLGGHVDLAVQDGLVGRVFLAVLVVISAPAVAAIPRFPVVFGLVAAVAVEKAKA